jgi:hypothetical protein
VQWIPLGLASLHSYFDGGRQRDLRLAAGCVSLQALSSGHGAVLMGVSVLLFGLYRLALGEPLRLAARARDLGLTGALLVVPTILVFLPYRAVQQEVGLRRGLGSWEPNYTSFIASPSHVHRFLTSLVTSTDVNATAASFLFPGYLPLVLAVVAIGLAGAALVRGVTLSPPSQWKPSIALKAVYLRPVRWLFVAALAWVVLNAARHALPAGSGLRGQYYANARWEGQPVMSVVDGEPSTEQLMARWNNKPPQAYSAAWNGYLSVVRPGQYFFSVASTDRSRLFVDNKLILNNRGDREPGEVGSIQLNRGPHRVVLEYVHVAGPAALDWEWATGGNDRVYTVVPRWALSQRPVSPVAVIAARSLETVLRGSMMLVVLAGLWCVLAWPINRHETWVHSLAPQRRNPTAFYTLLSAVCAGLVLGPPYGLWRFVYWLPGFSMIRESSRFMILTLLGIAVLAGIGFDKITRRSARRRRVVLATVVGVMLVAEYAAMPMAVRPSHFEIPAIDRWLDGQPKPFVVAEVPVHHLFNVIAFEGQETAYMIHSTAHWQKTVHGYSGWRTGFHWQLFSEMELFPDDTSVASLSDLGVTYVVVHTDLYPPGEWSKIEERLRLFSSRLRLDHIEGSGRVYALLKPVAEANR